MVPVVGFWETQTDISSADLRAALQGSGSADRAAVVGEQADAVAGALGITLGSNVDRLASAAKVRKAVANGALGVLAVTDVDPSVRALTLDGVALFGEQRTRDLGAWPLSISAGDGGSSWNTASTWTMLAGGDMFMDRGVYRAVVDQGKGVDYPFDGGTARVTGHHCCGEYVTIYEIPDVELTGNAGAVRSLVQNADLSVANLETPVPDNWVYHAHDYTFSSDPDLLPMFTNAGVDFVSIANNHIKDFGASGIADTRKNLQAAGLEFAGAGDGLSQAAQPAYLQANGTKVGFVACQGISAAYYATDSRAGALPCSNANVLPAIRAAKAKADLVVVFAHWGIEETYDPTSSQRSLAQSWVNAGAGLILGAHPHRPGAIEDIDGTIVLYTLGNFIFDQIFRTEAMESYLAEMTFQGTQMVQLTLHPFVAPNTQPNLLDPATDDGKAVMKLARTASEKIGTNW